MNNETTIEELRDVKRREAKKKYNTNRRNK